jgi:transposase
MSAGFWLSDDAWSAIEPLLPTNQPGARRVDDRRVISGIIHVLRVGCRWQDCPPEYGPSTTIYNRFNRWSRRGLWGRIFTILSAQTELPDDLSIDSTAVRAHRSAHGGKGGRQFRPTRSRKRPIPHDAAAYVGRNLIERAFCRLKDWRRIATRYDKLAINFASAVAIAAVILWWT